MKQLVVFLLLFKVLFAKFYEFKQILEDANAKIEERKSAFSKIEELIDPEAKSFVGRTYFYGIPKIVFPNYEKSAKCCEEGRSPECVFLLGLTYAHGLANYEQSSLNAIIHYEMAAALGWEEAHLALAYRYEHGLGVERSCTKARNHVFPVARKVAKQYLELRNVNILKAPRLSDDPKARKQQKDMVQFYELSKSATPDILLLLGRVFFYGIGGVDPDFSKSKRYFEEAYKKGEVVAGGYLGEIHYFGLGSPPDYRKAYHYFRDSTKAGAEGAAMSWNGLGLMHWHGREVLRDLAEAQRCFKKAMDLNYGEAFYNHAKVTLELNPADNDSSATDFFRAVKEGYAPAFIEVAGQSLFGDGCAFSLGMYKTVLNQRPALRRLEAAYDDYVFLGNENCALSEFLVFAEQGYEVAVYNAAYILEQNGYNDRALYLWQRSAQLGNVSSKVRVGDLFFQRQNFTAAAAHYYEAFEQKIPQATFNLAWMHLKGLGVPQDYFLARRYFDEAAYFGKNKPAWFPVALAKAFLTVVEVGASISQKKRTIRFFITALLLISAALYLLTRLRRQRTQRTVHFDAPLIEQVHYEDTTSFSDSQIEYGSSNGSDSE